MSLLSSPRIKVQDDVLAAFDDMYRRGFTDGLPVIPPTAAAVTQMLGGCDPQRLIARVPPRFAPATAEKVAINAVMAGCLPEYFPVVVAALKAVTQPGFNLLSIQTTTNPAAPVLVVNGPVRGQLDINCGRGCMGPGWRANATIGRALRLALLNVGACPPGDVDKAIHGMPGKFTFCFGELEEQSPWEPLSAEFGFARGRSTVTAFAGQGTQNLYATLQKAENIIHMLADGMRCYGNNDYFRATGTPLVVITPGHARVFASQGWDKGRIKRALYEQTQIPRSYIPETQPSGPVYADYPPGQMCRICKDPEDIRIVVAGGPEAYHITYIPSFGTNEACIEEIISPENARQ